MLWVCTICLIYNYRNKKLIPYNQEYLDYKCMFKEFFYNDITSLLLDYIKSNLFIILIQFSQHKYSTHVVLETQGFN